MMQQERVWNRETIRWKRQGWHDAPARFERTWRWYFGWDYMANALSASPQCSVYKPRSNRSAPSHERQTRLEIVSQLGLHGWSMTLQPRPANSKRAWRRYLNWFCIVGLRLFSLVLRTANPPGDGISAGSAMSTTLQPGLADYYAARDKTDLSRTTTDCTCGTLRIRESLENTLWRKSKAFMQA